MKLISRSIPVLPAIVFSVLLGISTANATGPSDPAELETFLDGFFTSAMDLYHVPGLAFVMVKDDQVFLRKAYGYANLAEQVRVNADRTVFRVASVSKAFTYLAAMQLSERGLLSLDASVNQYLTQFQFDDSYPDPITVGNLLTHTDGFEARIIGMYGRNRSELLPLGEYLKNTMPARTLPPGDFLTYGNYATVLTGYLIEEVSGTSFPEYMSQNIFQPLGMDRSSFHQPMPSELADDLAVAYAYDDGSYEPQPALHKNIAPAGGMYTTASDMARFMTALLRGDHDRESPILSEATVQEVFRRRFAHHPRLPGMTYGFLEYLRNDQRAVMRDGDGLGRSRVFLLPEHNLGFFVAYNSRVDELRDALARLILDRYYPKERAAAPRQPDSENRADRFAGDYRPVQFDQSTYTKIQILFATQNRVIANDDGMLTVEPLGMGDAYGGFEGASRWVEAGPLFFQRVDGAGSIAFQEDSQGRITHMFSGGGYLGVYEKVPWHETTGLHYILIGAFALIFFSAAVVWIVLLIRLLRGRPSPAGRMPLLAGSVGTLNLIFIVGVAPAIFLVGMTNGIPACAFGVSLIAVVMLGIPILSTALAAGLGIFAVRAWRNRSGSPGGRRYCAFVTLAALAFIPYLLYWNLLGFHF